MNSEKQIFSESYQCAPYPWPVSNNDDEDRPPDSSAISDDDNSSVDSDSSEPWTGNAPEGAAFEDDEAPPPDDTGPSNPPRRSKRSRGEYNPKTAGLHDGIRDGAYYKRLDKHPDYERCYHKSLVTDRIRNEGFIKANKQRFCCTLGTKQPPRSARIPRKRKEYKARLFCQKLQEANATMGSMEWEIPSPDELMSSELSRFVHFAATDCGFDGSVESLVINWLHPLMLAAKSKSNQEDNPDWNQAMNGPFYEKYWESACLEVETLERWTHGPA